MDARGLVAIGLLLVAGCSPHVDGEPGPMDMTSDDAGTMGPLPPPAPRLDPMPEAIPDRLAPIRGVARDARRVIVEFEGESVANTVLPDGSFCIEVSLEGDGPHTFVLWSQSEDGSFSERPATVTLTYDVTAPRMTGTALCGGNDPDACTGGEICGNGIDDDCNGRVDDADAACSDCRPDALEPNDGPDTPFISFNVNYENLEICPGERDFHPFFAYGGDHLVLTIHFTHADGDLDMRLHDIDNDRVLDTSASVTDDETIDFTATRNGHYALEVYGYNDARNTYSLIITD